MIDPMITPVFVFFSCSVPVNTAALPVLRDCETTPVDTAEVTRTFHRVHYAVVLHTVPVADECVSPLRSPLRLRLPLSLFYSIVSRYQPIIFPPRYMRIMAETVV